MPTLPTADAAEKLARSVESTRPGDLAEIAAELFPEARLPTPLSPAALARHVRGGLEAEELVDLWNVVFPQDRHVHYDEVSSRICYNEGVAEYAD